MNDLISRQAAIEALCKAGCKSEYCGISCDDVKAIEDLPSAQPEQVCIANVTLTDEQVNEAVEKAKNAVISVIKPEQRWIPCSERMPAYGEDVLISIGGYCNVGHIVSVNEEEQYNWYFSGWYHSPNDVDAWMPLPEPWEEGEVDEVD